VSNEDKKKKDGEQDPATEVGTTLRDQTWGVSTIPTILMRGAGTGFNLRTGQPRQ
jgi:hypothetical protein